MPGLGVGADLTLGHVPSADVVSPVELTVLDEEGSAAEEAIVEQMRPAVPAVRAPEQRFTNLLVSVDGRDAEIVPLAAIEVEDDGAEAENLGHRPGDEREDRGQIALSADELGDPDEGPDAGQLVSAPAPPAPQQAKYTPATPLAASRCSWVVAADRTVLLAEPAKCRSPSILVSGCGRIAHVGD